MFSVTCIHRTGHWWSWTSHWSRPLFILFNNGKASRRRIPTPFHHLLQADHQISRPKLSSLLLLDSEVVLLSTHLKRKQTVWHSFRESEHTKNLREEPWAGNVYIIYWGPLEKGQMEESSWRHIMLSSHYANPATLVRRRKQAFGAHRRALLPHGYRRLHGPTSAQRLMETPTAHAIRGRPRPAQPPLRRAHPARAHVPASHPRQPNGAAPSQQLSPTREAGETPTAYRGRKGGGGGVWGVPSRR